ncbi:MAG: penicillin acylase family protein [Bacteroidia bacterium]|nr:penicillin acylase family protein [Bacteroidia bacterium]
MFGEWWDNRGNLAEIPWSNEEPVSTPRGIKNPAKAVEILAQAAENVKKKFGAIDVTIGEIYRLRLNGYDFPSNGGPEHYGILRAMYYAPDSDGRMRAVAGDTYYAVTEFGSRVRSEVLLSYGNSSQPGSKHSGDQLQMMSEKKMRPALYYREDLEKSIEKREKFSNFKSR